jgi:Coenzyme PQQ synthesis protein D (PqqD)
MALSLKDTICRASVLGAEIDRDYILVDIEAGDYLHLNPIGAEIWKAIETPITIEALCQRLQPRFDTTPQTIESDVIAFLEQLETRGLLTRPEVR